MDIAESFIDKYNILAGFVVMVATHFLGKHWWLFAAFLLFNFVDWLTGWRKSKITGKENSAKGLQGVIKKLGYWIMIVVAFWTSLVLIEIGKVLGIDLQITTTLGWFVLASLIVNEIRSILENFVEAGDWVPEILVKGLAVASKVIDGDDKDGTLDIDTSDPKKDVYRLNLDIPFEELAGKDYVVLKINPDDGSQNLQML